MQLFEFHKAYPSVLSTAQTGSCLTPELERSGFELWHHYFPVKNIKTGEKSYFFINFMLLNSNTEDDKSLFGCKHVGLVYAGLMNRNLCFSGEVFFGDDLNYSKRTLSLRMGSNVCLEDSLVGNIVQDGQHYLAKLGIGNWGSISFELRLSPLVLQHQSFPSFLPYILNGYQTYWQTSQLKMAYDGHIVMNEEEYSVKSSEGSGYRDKMWGSSFGSYWLKIYGGELSSQISEISPERSAFLLICHSPVLWDYDLGKKYCLVLIINDKVYHFSHSIYAKQSTYHEKTSGDSFSFTFSGWNLQNKVEVNVEILTDVLHSLSYPTPQNLLQQFLVASPISVNIKLFSIKNLLKWHIIDEITVEGACLAQT